MRRSNRSIPATMRATMSEHDQAPDPGPSEFAHRWACTSYDVATPAERVFLSMRGDDDLTIGFQPGWYARCTTSQMQTELARAAKLLYVTRTRAFYDLRSQLAGQRVEPATTVLTDAGARYKQGLDELAAHGQSSDGSASISMVGLTHYTVSIRPGTLDRLSEGQFKIACREAGLACFADHTRGWQRLHFDIYTRPLFERAGVPVP